MLIHLPRTWQQYKQIEKNFKQILLNFKFNFLDKYRSEIKTQPKNNNLDYLIDPVFRTINRLFVLSFKNGNDDSTRSSFDEYYKSQQKSKMLIH